VRGIFNDGEALKAQQVMGLEEICTVDFIRHHVGPHCVAFGSRFC